MYRRYRSQRSQYKLLVKGAGSYSSSSLLSLLLEILKHRMYHLFKGEGFKD